MSLTETLLAIGGEPDVRRCKTAGCVRDAHWTHGPVAGYCRPHGEPILAEKQRRGGLATRARRRFGSANVIDAAAAAETATFRLADAILAHDEAEAERDAAIAAWRETMKGLIEAGRVAIEESRST